MPNPQNKIYWTQEMDNFLKENYESMTNRELAKAMGLRLTSTRTRLYSLGMRRMEMEYWTEEQVKFLLENYKFNGDTEIAEFFNGTWHKDKGWTKKHIEKKRRYLKLKRTDAQKRKIKERNTLQGRFSINHWKRWDNRANAIGTIVAWNLEYGPVKYIKTEIGYIKLSHYNWINVNGEIPEAFIIIHKDFDPMNCEVDNLECISKAENITRNSGSVSLSDTYVAGIMTHKDPLLREEILKYPELIDLKRKSLQLNREINNGSIKK